MITELIAAIVVAMSRNNAPHYQPPSTLTCNHISTCSAQITFYKIKLLWDQNLLIYLLLLLLNHYSCLRMPYIKLIKRQSLRLKYTQEGEIMASPLTLLVICLILLCSLPTMLCLHFMSSLTVQPSNCSCLDGIMVWWRWPASINTLGLAPKH